MTTSLNIENYHLKWDSHLSYLNLSVATLFKNEKFADVMLLSSNSEGGTGVLAHRVILSSCSHFFASILDLTPSVLNNIIYIVLPPEISKRSMQILVQYMYSGEATVPNDILNEVLRGGEILKIRGLYRSGTSNTGPHNNGNNEHKNGHQYSSISSRGVETMCCMRFDQDKQSELRAYNTAVTIPPNESPVIVRSPKHPHHPTSNGPLNLSSSTQTISVKKDMAIDPQEGCMSSACYAIGSFHKPTGQSTSEKLCPKFASLPEQLLCTERDRTRRHSEDVSSIRQECLQISRNSVDDEQSQRVDRRRTSLPGTMNCFPNDRQKRASEHDHQCEGDLPQPLKLLTIKEEPVDWQGDPEDGCSPQIPKLPPPLDIVKTESVVSEEERSSDKEDDEEMIYSPLTCELCAEKFTVPKEWVRHIESHMDIKSYVPKKRRRMPSTNTTEIIQSLKCDLCATFYLTPAEWVRHIQTAHTETELAMCNNRHGSGSEKRNATFYKPKQTKTSMSRLNYLSYLGKTCNVCKKKFPSYASMVIHSRTHTGEKPFHCSSCNKGFNVKSNLLRHMRTLHKWIEPSVKADLK